MKDAPQSDPGPSRRRAQQAWLVGFACALWVLACFVPTWGFDFVNWDDALHVTENPLVLAPHAHSASEHLLTPALGYPTPVTLLSYCLEASWFGLASATPFHVDNVLLHALSVCLVFALARSLKLGLHSSALSALIFGLHPVAAEPVSWVSGRKDLLAALFALAALWLSMKRPLDWRQPRSFGVLALFTLAMLAKPVAAYVALVIPLWRWLGCRPLLSPLEHSSRPGARRPGRARLKEPRALLFEALPLVVVVLVVLPIAFRGQAATLSIKTNLGVWQLLRNAWFALGFHLQLLLGLTEPSAKHLPPAWPAPFTPQVDLLPLAVVASMLWLSFRLGPNLRRKALAGLGFMGLSYLPNSNLIPLTRTLADVYVFMPTAGLAWWLGAVSEPLFAALRRPLLGVLGVVGMGALLTLGCLQASSHWQNGVSLWQHAYEQYPHDYRLCRNLGNARFEWEGAEAALLQYRSCASSFGDTGFAKNIGLAELALGNRDAARRALERALKYAPHDRTVHAYLAALNGAQPAPRSAKPSDP